MSAIIDSNILTCLVKWQCTLLLIVAFCIIYFSCCIFVVACCIILFQLLQLCCCIVKCIQELTCAGRSTGRSVRDKQRRPWHRVQPTQHSVRVAIGRSSASDPTGVNLLFVVLLVGFPPSPQGRHWPSIHLCATTTTTHSTTLPATTLMQKWQK